MVMITNLSKYDNNYNSIEIRSKKVTLLEPIRRLDKFVIFPVFDSKKKLWVASDLREDFKHFPIMPEFLQ